MAKLTKRQSLYIVDCYARYMAPWEIIAEMKDAFGLEVTKQQVYYYNPDGLNDLGAELRAYFNERRAEYRAEIEKHGAAILAWRLDQLSQMAIAAKLRGNFKLAAQMLEQARVEMEKFEEKHHQRQNKTQQVAAEVILNLIATYATKNPIEPAHRLPSATSATPATPINPLIDDDQQYCSDHLS